MKKVVSVLIAAALVMTAFGVAWAGWKPEKSVSIIVAYKAGSGTDNTARVLSKFATKSIGQTLVIQNQPGGSGSIGWTALSQSKPTCAAFFCTLTARVRAGRA